MANIGEPMRRHHVIPLDHPIPATTEPTPPHYRRQNQRRSPRKAQN